MLLDGYGLVYRAFFALPDLTTSKGTLVKGVFGFASIVLRGLQDLKPDYLAVSFDLPGPTFRHEQYAEYKATRTKMPDELRDQFPMVREVVKALRIPVYELQGYEADDVIGTITRQMEPLDVETTIVTVDLDMLQLVTPKTRLMTTRSGVENTVIYDVARIDERFGLRPDQMIDYKALKGIRPTTSRVCPVWARRPPPSSSGSTATSRACSSSSRPSPRRSCARSSATTATRCSWAGSSRGSCATCRSRWTSKRRDSATTIARPSSGCSGSTSSGP